MTLFYILITVVLLFAKMTRESLLFFLFCSLAADNPNESPGMGIYDGPLSGLGEFLYTSIGPFKVFGIEALLVAFIVIFRFRSILSEKNQITRYCGVIISAIIAFEAYGLITGGNIRFSMLQIRPMVSFCLLTFLIASCKAGIFSTKDALNIITAASLYRAISGIHFWYFTLRNGVIDDPEIGGGAYVLTHSDSVLMSISISHTVIRILIFNERVNITKAAFLVLTLFFVIINNRRLAFVEIFSAIFVCYFYLNNKQKQQVRRVIRRLSPAILLYMILSWNSTCTAAKPIQIIRSSIEQNDASSATRGIENYNLVRTARERPFIGWGFGHMYKEEVKAFSISHKFEAYRYVPHNSLIWLYCAGGIVFPTIYFWLFVLACRRPSDPQKFKSNTNSMQQDSANYYLEPLAITIHIIQSFGDMGLQSWMGSICIATIIGTSHQRRSNEDK